MSYCLEQDTDQFQYILAFHSLFTGGLTLTFNFSATNNPHGGTQQLLPASGGGQDGADGRGGRVLVLC